MGGDKPVQQLLRNVLLEGRKAEAEESVEEVEELAPPPLQQLALQFAAGGDRICLTGMRKPAYVQTDAAAVLRSPAAFRSREAQAKVVSSTIALAEELGAEGRGLWK